MITYRYEYAEIHFNDDGSIKTVFANRLGKTPDGVEFNAGQVTLADADLVAFLSSIDASALAQRDQLAADKAALETSLNEMTADRDKQASELAAKVVELASAMASHAETIAEKQAAYNEIGTSKAERDSIWLNLTSVTQDRDELRAESASKSETLDLLQMQYDTMAAVAANLPTVEAERNAALSQLHEAQATIEALNEKLAKPVTETRPGPTYLYPAEFQERFTIDEQDAIDNASSFNGQLRRFMRRLYTVRWVNTAAAETIEGIQMLAAGGIIHPDRVLTILAPIAE